MVWAEPANDNESDDGEAPETPLDEPTPIPIEDPLAEPDAPPIVVESASWSPAGTNYAGETWH